VSQSPAKREKMDMRFCHASLTSGNPTRDKKRLPLADAVRDENNNKPLQKVMNYRPTQGNCINSYFLPLQEKVARCDKQSAG
jgi:hypothetical protein